MYPISNYALDLLKRNYRQIAEISVWRNGEVILTITESDIVQGGLTIDRYCISGNSLELGSAIASELTLELDNRDDKFSHVSFEGVELEVKIGLQKWDAYKWENAQVEWIPCGFFTVDDPPRKLSSIKLSALDRMVRFDCRVTGVNSPIPACAMLLKCCEDCGVELTPDTKAILEGYANALEADDETLAQYDSTRFKILDYLIDIDFDTEEITYRHLIQWISQMCGTCAYIDWDGKLRLEWYHDTPTIITPSDRYQSDMYEKDISVTGIRLGDVYGRGKMSGGDGYIIDLGQNGIIESQIDMIADFIYEFICPNDEPFCYRPYSCTIKSMPHLYPLDKIKYVDKHGIEHDSIITHYTFRMNSATSIAGKGETSTKNNYSSVASNRNRNDSYVAFTTLRSYIDGKEANLFEEIGKTNDKIALIIQGNVIDAKSIILALNQYQNENKYNSTEGVVKQFYLGDSELVLEDEENTTIISAYGISNNHDQVSWQDVINAVNTINQV